MAKKKKFKLRSAKGLFDLVERIRKTFVFKLYMAVVTE